MVILPRAQSRLLDKAIHRPAAEMAKNAKLITSLRLRNKLADRDLVAFAGFLAEEPEKAEEFEALLKANLKLLSPTILHCIPKAAPVSPCAIRTPSRAS